ncbi:IS66 family transposase zinc-finger binding domain-containing protein [Sinisalibacter aestuarii]|uniref:IS66 family transposase zinc-finger binding domain-containing protein n=1 Tax=Sinisalibacter aestuarii TaxID=2949426 RepID=UPI0033658D4D
MVSVGTGICPRCGGPLRLVGERISEMPDCARAQLKIVRLGRPKYGCRQRGTRYQAPAPERPIAKGLARRARLTHVLINM